MKTKCKECEREEGVPHVAWCSQFVTMVALAGQKERQWQPQLWAGGGLAVSPGWDGRHFAVTHVATGFNVGRFGGKTNAIGFARKALKVVDWTAVSRKRLRLTKEQAEEIGVLRALFNSLQRMSDGSDRAVVR